MCSTTVLYDGWPLVFEPDSPAAMHLQALLAHVPAQVEAHVALPGPAPGWLKYFPTHLQQTRASEAGHLLWEQRILSRIVSQAGAQILHLTSPGAPLLGRSIRVISPGAYEGINRYPGQRSSQTRESEKARQSFAARLRSSLEQGGLARARAILWPDDVPAPDLPVPVIQLPPVVHPAFTSSLDESVLAETPALGSDGHPRLEMERTTRPGSEQQSQVLAACELPERYVLYHGPTGLFWLQRLLESWQWASGPVGDQIPLVVLGLPENLGEAFGGMVKQFDLIETVRVLPAVPFEELSAVYQGCSVYFHPAPLSPWGGPVRNALACGKPVVSAESQLADKIVGPAAYLAPAGDTRSLGAALLTVLVEEEVARELSQAALERSRAWRSPAFGQALFDAYRQILTQ